MEAESIGWRRRWSSCPRRCRRGRSARVGGRSWQGRLASSRRQRWRTGGHSQGWPQADATLLQVHGGFEIAPRPPVAARAVSVAPPGARDTIYHDPKHTTAAIVTCGGLCPGLNDVVAGLVNKLTDYGVPEGNILGIRYGFKWVWGVT